MKTICTLLLLLISISANSQTKISGVVKTAKGEAVKGANISIKNSYDGGTADSAGVFRFQTSETGKITLLFSSVGFVEDSVALESGGTEIQLTLILKKK